MGKVCPNCGAINLKKILLMFTFALIFSLAFIQAPAELIEEEPIEISEIAIPIEPLEDKAGWTIDNKYDFYNNIDLGKAEIKSTILWIIPSDPIEDITLKENTYTCGEECYAKKEITIYKDTKLVDSVRFETIKSDGTRVEEPIRDYQFYILSKRTPKEVEDYSWICEETGKLSLNGTAETSCSI